MSTDRTSSATTRRCRRWGHKWFPSLDGDYCQRFGCNSFRPSPFMHLMQQVLSNGSEPEHRP